MSKMTANEKLKIIEEFIEYLDAINLEFYSPKEVVCLIEDVCMAVQESRKQYYLKKSLKDIEEDIKKTFHTRIWEFIESKELYC